MVCRLTILRYIIMEGPLNELAVRKSHVVQALVIALVVVTLDGCLDQCL